MSTVIVDRRPTRAEVEAAMRDGVSRWLVSRYVLEVVEFVGVAQHGRVTMARAKNRRDESFPIEVETPSEIWRPIAPDGEPLTLEAT